MTFDEEEPKQVLQEELKVLKPMWRNLKANRWTFNRPESYEVFETNY